MAKDETQKIHSNLAYNYLMNYNYKVKAENFGVKYEMQQRYKTYKQLTAELESLAQADVVSINKAARECYIEYMRLLEDKVYPIIDKALGNQKSLAE